MIESIIAGMAAAASITLSIEKNISGLEMMKLLIKGSPVFRLKTLIFHERVLYKINTKFKPDSFDENLRSASSR